MLRVLFVCTGNICRSPMAHGFMADVSGRLLGGAIEVRSAGTWAHPGSPPTFDAVHSARERGVDIAELQSTPFSPRLARWADLVVAMTAEQRAEIVEQAPGARDKTFTLKELVPLLDALPDPAASPTQTTLLERVAAANDLRLAGGVAPPADEDVADPLGLPADAFGAVASEIKTLTGGLVRGLVGSAERAPIPEG